MMAQMLAWFVWPIKAICHFFLICSLGPMGTYYSWHYCPLKVKVNALSQQDRAEQYSIETTCLVLSSLIEDPCGLI